MTATEVIAVILSLAFGVMICILGTVLGLTLIYDKWPDIWEDR